MGISEAFHNKIIKKRRIIEDFGEHKYYKQVVLMGLFFPEEWVEEVRASNDIVDVISDYVQLKRSGRGFFGLCPFHNEKTASFHVNPESQLYHCFGCGVGGNVFNFIMAIERLDFYEAVKLMAERAGIPLPNTMDVDKFTRSKKIRDQMYELHKEAARFYFEILMSKEGRKALEYLQSRGLDKSTIKAFGLGYAPDGWETIKTFLKQKNYPEELLIESGIVVKNSNNRVYDRFRNRIMFPIIHPRGMVIGFGGRVLDDSLPKYLNSSDSLIFNKSSTLYGLNLVRKQLPIENLIIVEGYMDVISLHQFGFKNAVASLGTSLTREQAKMLRRYAGEVYIAYDGDTAGQKATLRGLDILQEAGCKVKVMQFPKGQDPDEVLRKYGPEYFKKLMNNALSLVDYKLEQLKNEYDLNSQEGRTGFASAAARILVKLPNLLERDVHIQRLEALTGFKSRIIYQEIERLERNDASKGVKEKRIGNNRLDTAKGSLRILIPSNIKAERDLIALMALSEENAKKILKKLDVQDFEDPIHREIVSIIKKLIESDKEVNPAQILNYVGDQDKIKKMVEIFTLQIEYDNTEKYMDDCINEVLLSGLEKRRQELLKQITELEQSEKVDPVKYRSLIQELGEVNRKLKTNR